MATETAKGRREDPIPTSVLLMSASRHIASKCRDQNKAFLDCKKNDANPEKCLDKGRDVTQCVFTGYKPPAEFQKADVVPMFGGEISESKEVWLIEVPLNEFDPALLSGKELSLKSIDEGYVSGSVEDSHGRTYNLTGLKTLEFQTFAFLPSCSTSLGVQKISRHAQLLNLKRDKGSTKQNSENSVDLSHSIRSSRGIASTEHLSIGSSKATSGISFEGDSNGGTPSKKLKKFNESSTSLLDDLDGNMGKYEPSHSSKRRIEEDSTAGRKKKKQHRKNH